MMRVNVPTMCQMADAAFMMASTRVGRKLMNAWRTRKTAGQSKNNSSESVLNLGAVERPAALPMSLHVAE